MRVFIIRPFDIKKDTAGKEINFNRVEDELIKPVLERLKFTGGTTAEITEQGNIREDMFEELLKADLVIADISIHNANVFYELGIRHALRDKYTYLIRCRADDTPFDLRTDRYLEYDRDDPKAACDSLYEGLNNTVQGDRKDSPVFQLLPRLEAQDWTRLIVVPEGFREEVERVAKNGCTGDLMLLADETKAFYWAPQGLRDVGNALFNLKAYDAARDVWESLKERLLTTDFEVEQKLATVYQRLKDLTRSDQAVNRALKSEKSTSYERAELYSLRGSNEKTRWMENWVPEQEKGLAAFRSRYLESARDCYWQGFKEDLNHYYSGINALSFITILLNLAERYPQEWSDSYETDKEADDALAEFKTLQEEMTAAVNLSVEAARERLKRNNVTDVWLELTAADLCFLTQNRPTRVATVYRKALQGEQNFVFDAVRRQLTIFQELGIREDNVKAVLEVIDELGDTDSSSTQGREILTRVFLFTGHMVDQAGAKPRFPADKEKIAFQAIKDRLQEEQASFPGVKIIGMAGGACGGDILFHEACAELGIETQMFLALPYDEFMVNSVSFAGGAWQKRFIALYEKLKPRVLQEHKALPRWLAKRKDYSVWQRSNLWMLNNALAYGSRNVSLFALWNGEPSGKVGGTDDMVEQAKQTGAHFVHINTKEIFRDEVVAG